MTFTQGQRVSTPYGLGSVAYQRMAPPDYSAAEAVSVVLDVKRAQLGYTGTILAASDVQPIGESEPHTIGTETPTPENDPIGRFRGGQRGEP